MEDGVDGRSERAAGQDSKGVKRQCLSSFYGANGTSIGRRRATASGRGIGLESWTYQKGEHELKSGLVCADAFNQRGRKRSEEHLPNLLKDITAIVDGQSQADPQFRTNRLYTRLTATEVRRQLITQKR